MFKKKGKCGKLIEVFHIASSAEYPFLAKIQLDQENKLNPRPRDQCRRNAARSRMDPPNPAMPIPPEIPFL
jgi:hypothetical protein